MKLQCLWRAPPKSQVLPECVTARPCGDTHQFHSCSLQPKNQCSVPLTPPSSASLGLSPLVGTGPCLVIGGILGKQVVFAELTACQHLPNRPRSRALCSEASVMGLPFPGFGLLSLASQRFSLFLDWGLNQSMGQRSCLFFCWNLYQRGRDTCLQGCGSGSEKRAV